MTEKLDLDDIEANVSSWPVGYVMKTIVRRLVARIRELEADRDSWAEQASQRVADWEREHELRIAAERRVGELERASQLGGGEAENAARYKLLRRKVCIVDGKFHILNLVPTYIGPDAAVELDVTIDAARASLDGRRGS